MSFWELSARDIDENLIEFSQFKGKRALLIVNVASEAKLTDSNYKQLNEMKEQSIYHSYDLSNLAYVIMSVN